MKEAKLFNLLISCPGDIKDEVGLIRKAIDNFNELYADQGIIIQPRYWAKSAYPQSGGKPQSLLNRQFVDKCDAAVALFWTRFGTPTDEYGSGTEEEIEIMLNAGKQVFLYFSDAPFTPSAIDQEQYKQVQAFKSKYQGRGIYWTYDSVDKFYELFTMHLPKFLIGHLNNELEAQRRVPQLKLMGIDECNGLVDACCVTKFKPLVHDTSSNQIDKIRWLFERIKLRSTAKTVMINSPFGEILASIRNPVVFDEDKKKTIIAVAETLGIEIDDMFFDLGGLEEPLSLNTAPFSRPALKGTEAEIEKYKLLLDLHTTIINHDAWYPFEEAHAGKSCLKLAVQNYGTAYAHDVEIRLRFCKAALLPHTSFPSVPYNTMQYLYTEFSLDEIFGIPACLSYSAYSDTLKQEPLVQEPRSRTPSDFLWGPDYEEKYTAKLDETFCYDLYTEGEFSYVCLRFDVLKHNSSAAFPTPIFMRDSVDSIDYTITAKELSTPMTGVIHVNN